MCRLTSPTLLFLGLIKTNFRTCQGNGLGRCISCSQISLSAALNPPSRPPARLRVIQSSEPLHNFPPTLKLSLCHFGAKSLMVMDLLVQSISKKNLSAFGTLLASSHPQICIPSSQSLGFDVWSSLSAAPTRPVDIECFLSFIFSTCDHVFLL